MTSSPGRRLQARRAVLQTTMADDNRRLRPTPETVTSLAPAPTLCVGGPAIITIVL